MRIVDLIQKKKEGKKHDKQEIQFIVQGYTEGKIEDYQISAWLMAVCLKGLDTDETAWMTEAFIQSGDVLDFSSISHHILDKHSTGGVGDKVTIALIPILAACGGICAKLSGKGLGYTGGTVDKLEAIPGFKCALSIQDFKEQIKKIGCAISSQTPNLTPADAKFYALRDVTATVDNKSLICASVVSKKIASGADHIVLDVKYGNGAFIKTKEEAFDMAQLMIDIAHRLNKKIRAVITPMNQPLGTNIGNALEIIESIELLKDNYKNDLYEVTAKIASLLLVEAGICKGEKEALELIDKKIKLGDALKKFKEIIKAQGGDEKITENYELLKLSPQKTEIFSDKEGYVTELEALNIAKACKIAGGGREKKTDDIDYGVGVVLNKKMGEEVKKGELLAYFYGEKQISEAVELIKNAYKISKTMPVIENLIYKVL